VLTLTDAQVAIADTAEGYVLEAAVPLAALFSANERQGGGGYGPLWPGRILVGDVGVVIGDTTGRRVARLYRFNQGTQVVSDVPTEARLYPAAWGELEVTEAPHKGK